MRRRKQHRAVLKRLLRDERLTPKRGHLAVRLLKRIDAIELEDIRRYEIQALNHIGAPIEQYVAEMDATTNAPAKSVLRDHSDDGGHVTITNRLLRDPRAHPNTSLALEVEALWEDAETTHERVFFRQVLDHAFADGRGLVTVDRDEPIEDSPSTKAERESRARAMANLDLILGGKSAGNTTSDASAG